MFLKNEKDYVKRKKKKFTRLYTRKIFLTSFLLTFRDYNYAK